MIEMYKTWNGYKIRKHTRNNNWIYVGGYYAGEYKWVVDYIYAKAYSKATAMKHVERLGGD